MFKIDFIALLAIFGIFQALFIASLFWLRKNRSLANSFFSLLLFATSVRIAKNVIVHLSSIEGGLQLDPALWRFSVNFGLSHQFAIGPLFLFYFKSKLQPSLDVNWSIVYHFIPYIILTLFAAIIPWTFWRDGGLWASYSHILIYYLLAVHLYYRSFRNVKLKENGNADLSDYKWLRLILIISAILMIAYSPSLFKYIGYIGGATLYAIGVYVVSWIILKERKLKQNERYTTSALNDDQSRKISQDLQLLIEKEQLYLDSKLSLKKLSERLNLPGNYLSQAINQQFNCSYSDYINSYRLKEAKKRLVESQYAHLKIAAIAYDCGFESISSFNTAFKKAFNQTPSAYRDTRLITKL